VQPVIEVRDVVNRFGSQSVHDGVSFDVFPGEIFGIVGGSGTGKSVLLRTILGRVDVLLVNEGEARLLTGQRSLARAASAIHAMGPERVIIKKGEHGALLFGRDSVLAVPAMILDEVIDPTGAGDCFAGGFMGSLAEAGVGRDAPDSAFRQAMLDGTVTASFCPEGFSVEGLLRADDAAYADRLRTLRAMMMP